MYSVDYLEEALKELAELDKPMQKLIKEKITKLAENPDNLKNNIKALKGEHKGKYRLRVGDYRVVYKIENNILLILIVRIGHRKEVY